MTVIKEERRKKEEGRRERDRNRDACEKFPKQITSMADKIKYICSNASEEDENTIKELQEMIKVCQEGLDNMGCERDEYESKLQKRKEEIVAKIMKR